MRQFWITFKQFVLYLLLSQGIMVVGGIVAVIRGGMNGVEKDAMMEYMLSSKITLWSMVLGYAVTIAVARVSGNPRSRAVGV